MNTINTVGTWSGSANAFNIATSCIWDELLNNILFVETHKTDLLYTINSIEKELNEVTPNGFAIGLKERIVWIGYRANGVDSYNTIYDNLYDERRNEIKQEAYWYYRKLFRLSFKIVGGEIHVELAEKDAHDFYREVRRGGF